MENTQIKIKIAVDTSEVDAAIKKFERLVQLKEATDKKWWQFWK